MHCTARQAWSSVLISGRSRVPPPLMASSFWRRSRVAARDEVKMLPPLLLVLLIAFMPPSSSTTTAQALDGARRHGHGHGHGRQLKSKTFLSPPISLRPGSVSNKWYTDVAFPCGHVALKSFNGELVDARGAAVPLHETYLHHWLLVPYYAAGSGGEMRVRPNAGVCNGTLGQYFGLGAETRRTATWVPDPYGIEAGGVDDDDDDVHPAAGPSPEGRREERWMLNVHAIDTRGAVDKLGCAECRCDLYNVTVDKDGQPIGSYPGGPRCCYDRTRCEVEEGFVNGEARVLFLRYTVMWIDWSAAVVPVRIYILDVTDRALLEGRSEPECLVDYQVQECSSENREKNDCVHVMVGKQVLPRGGDIVYAVGHQHAAGIGTSLHGQDGRLLCWSTPIYGEGQEAGDEAGYVVGMSACYPEQGAAKVADGEALTVVSNYSSETRHTGVMGHYYILVADEQEQEEQQHQQPAPSSKQQPSALCFSFPVPWCVPSWLSIEMDQP